MPSTDKQHLQLGPELRLVVHRRSDETLDIRLARRSPMADPNFSGSWQPMQAGFRLPLDRVAEFGAILRDLGEP